ncbi:zinc-binding dehydrogenase [Asticcacaulis sp. DXS10W]|uniref:Zinc-binding dehydrogenase n=1 Tax=Asticcacaulis currens TaxID=2984210 RepID=A0ABT5IDG6_9CAUL|nr:zinc-binding dehydrogenase [Asticcacaulis currens]MDC7694221.1 zinc-binding dehydrogenase [Asticcacaulis currens]
MRAFEISAIGDANLLTTTERPIPKPREGQLLVRNAASGINFLDVMIRGGLWPDAPPPTFPYVPGVEGAGVVEDVGTGQTAFRNGDRVAWMGPLSGGGYAEYSLVDHAHVYALPDGIDIAVAAGIPMNYLTAWSLLHDLAQVKEDDFVLVHAAAGGVGLALIQLARCAGVHTIGVASAGKLGVVLTNGATAAIDKADRAGLLAEVRRLAGNKGVRASFNPIGGETLAQDLDLLSPYGIAVAYGLLEGLPGSSLAAALFRNFGRNVGVRVSDVYRFAHGRPIEAKAAMQQIFSLAALGRISPVIQTTRPDGLVSVHRKLQAGETNGKFIIDWQH